MTDLFLGHTAQDPRADIDLLWSYLTAPGSPVIPGTGLAVTTLASYLANTAVTNPRNYSTLAIHQGVLDATAAFQAAHDALPATGGVIMVTDGLYSFTTDGVYVTITKPNVSIIGTANAWVISPNSADAEVRTGSRYLNGFAVTGNNCRISVNMRGPLVMWTSGSASDVISLSNMKFLNMYNAGLFIGNTPFAVADFDGVEFNTSRDLASDAGNYECIARSANSADGAGQLVRVNRCLFRGVSGGIDAHNVRNLVVGGGTRFEGVDINCIKLATLNGGVSEQNLTVDASVTFDGAPINPLSANRHLTAAVQAGDRPTAGTRYLGFLQIFNNVRFHGKAANFPNFGVTFLDGTFTNAVLNFDGARFDTCTNAIYDPQGSVSMRGIEMIASSLNFSSVATLRSLDIHRARLRNSVLVITKNCVSPGNIARIRDCDIDYSVDNNGPIRFTNTGTDNGLVLIVDDNTISITGGGNTVAADLSTSGTRGFWLPGNRISAAAGTPVVTGGAMPGTYEQQTAAGTTSLYLSRFHHGETVVRNPNAAGVITYDIRDAALNAEIGTVFHAFRDHASNNLAFLATSMKGAEGSGTTATATTQYASATFRKVAAGTWIMTASRGTWTIA